ncbi:MAG: outer membrane protein transport protein [Thermodesulfobacteriota bacterium]|nr:outer membrane protein transport protein [Thermodesulfobacteriota bacterium]
MRDGLLKRIGLGLGLCFGLLLSVTAAPSSARASGFALHVHGAKGMGMTTNVIAHTEGPASNHHNPALLTELEGTHIEAGTSPIFLSREFKSAETGKTEKTGTEVFYPSTIFVTHQLHDRLTAGLGIVSPFGLETDWGKKWEGRYLITSVELKSFNINPNIAWKITDKLSVAGGVNLLLLDATLENNVNLSTFGLPDGEQKFDGDGHDVGFNMGLLYHLNQDWSFGASYRSPFTVDVDGDAEHTLPAGSPPELGMVFPNTDGSTDIELPRQVFVGLCYRGVEKLTVECGIRWEGWSSFDELAFEFDEPIAGSETLVVEKDWEDVVSYSIGAKYDIDDTFAILGGFRFDENPIPDDTFEPMVPEADKYDFTIGCIKTFGDLAIAVSYAYEKYESRDKENQVGATLGGTANGEYNTDAQAVAVSVSYVF